MSRAHALTGASGREVVAQLPPGSEAVGTGDALLELEYASK